MPCFSFVSGRQGLHEQGGLREGIRMMMADFLTQCIAGSIRVYSRSAISCHRHRLCEMRKTNDPLRLEQPYPVHESYNMSMPSMPKFT